MHAGKCFRQKQGWPGQPDNLLISYSMHAWNYRKLESFILKLLLSLVHTSNFCVSEVQSRAISIKVVPEQNGKVE
jgi:hypothetical protein